MQYLLLWQWRLGEVVRIHNKSDEFFFNPLIRIVAASHTSSEHVEVEDECDGVLASLGLSSGVKAGEMYAELPLLENGGRRQGSKCPLLPPFCSSMLEGALSEKGWKFS